MSNNELNKSVLNIEYVMSTKLKHFTFNVTFKQTHAGPILLNSLHYTFPRMLKTQDFHKLRLQQIPLNTNLIIHIHYSKQRNI